MKLIPSVGVAVVVLICLAGCDKRDALSAPSAVASHYPAPAITTTETPQVPIDKSPLSEKLLDPEVVHLHRCGIAGTEVTPTTKSFAAISATLDRAKCLSDFIVKFPGSQHFGNATAWRSAYLMAGLTRLAEIEKDVATSAAPASAGEAQRQLIENKAYAGLGREFDIFKQLVIDDMTRIYMAMAVVRLEESGIVFINAREEFLKVKRSDHLTSTAKEVVAEYLDGKLMRTWWWPFGAAYSFAIDGYGRVEPIIRLTTQDLNGSLLSPNCLVSVEIAKKDRAYSCKAYLEGIDQVTIDMHEAVTADLLKRTDEARVQGDRNSR